MRNLFKCGQCRYNRDCHGGNGPYSNQFRHCRIEDKIAQKNKAMRKLLEWADECGFTFDQIWDENFLDKKEFEKHTKDMDIIDAMIYYAERWIEEYERDGKS